ncbi:PQQ-binding-like beta-propeller repeat protein [Stieleria varia]|uniref:Outer membrane biogenesis protein BamB n=1 Tax=Stieleria varia TaxID=2528005 RepID=A0A5C6B8C2_9BACT|nr:PQQ-binding-like beta-propeller repeat protein [Stieleria varia]TWU07882.1 outer membrane biogenesis protein BamB [Stieleria varia]
MSRFPSFSRSIGVTLLCCLCVSVSFADDWNQWMGPTRDGVYREAGIADSIPEGGLPIRWRVPVFGGYAGPAVVGDRVYLMDYERTKGEMIETPDARPEQEGFERVRCFDANTGNQVWEHKYAVNYKISYPAGPRATPTVIDGVVVTLGAQGDLIALNASNGEMMWQVNLPKTFNAKTPIWGFAAHPLVTDSMVVTMVGGDDQAAVAFDRATGKVLWKSVSSSDAGYCPPSLIQAGGTQQLLIWHPDAVASLDPATGKPYWTEPLKPDYGMSIAQPMREGDHLFVTGIENKSMMLQLASDRPAVTKLWDSEPKTSISCSTMTPVIHDGLIFGCDESLGAVVCAKVSDGQRLWHNWLPVRPDNQRRLSAGNAFITRHAPSGRYLLFGETGLLTLAEMTAEGFRSLGQMQVVEPTQTAFGRKVIWSHPAYARQTAFIRNDKELVAVDLSSSK